MLPVDLRDFITIMSIVIFGALIFSGILTLIAYALAIKRGTSVQQPNQKIIVLPEREKEPAERHAEYAVHDR